MGHLEDSCTSGTGDAEECLNLVYITFVPEAPQMDFDTDIWSEIQDSSQEIFDLDIPELSDNKFDVNEYLNSNYDY